jgi:hypothetical protein
MSEWRRIAPVELPPDDKPVLVYFEGRIEVSTYEGGVWYIRRLGRAGIGNVTWWRPMPEGPGGEA